MTRQSMPAAVRFFERLAHGLSGGIGREDVAFEPDPALGAANVVDHRIHQRTRLFEDRQLLARHYQRGNFAVTVGCSRSDGFARFKLAHAVSTVETPLGAGAAELLSPLGFLYLTRFRPLRRPETTAKLCRRATNGCWNRTPGGRHGRET